MIAHTHIHSIYTCVHPTELEIMAKIDRPKSFRLFSALADNWTSQR